MPAGPLPRRHFAARTQTPSTCIGRDFAPPIHGLFPRRSRMRRSGINTPVAAAPLGNKPQTWYVSLQSEGRCVMSKAQMYKIDR